MYRYTLQSIIERKPIDSLLEPIRLEEPLLDKKGKQVARVLVRCECGTTKIVLVKSFLGRTLSCGCLHKKIVSKLFTKYPNANKHILSSYNAMMNRCYFTTNHAYHLYGGNGVKVCQEWVDNYFSFEKWSLENGWKPGLVIDKDIKGTGLLYSPENCMWATQKQNSNKKVNSVYYIFNGQKLTLSQIAELIGIKRATIDSRLRSGMSFENAVSLPVQDKLLNLNKRHNEKK